MKIQQNMYNKMLKYNLNISYFYSKFSVNERYYFHTRFKFF
jgi:hypothetical protein